MVDERTAPWPNEPEEVGEPRFSLLVVHDGATSVYPLPASGRLLIGRSPEADIRIDHRSLSREHAALHVGAALTIEDLGSSNGTRVRDLPLVPRVALDIYPDDVVDLGAVLLIVQYRSPSARPRRICHRAELELRIDEEHERGDVANFAIVHLDIERGLPSHAVQMVLASSLADDDLLAAGEAGGLDVLLAGVKPEDADLRAAELVDRLAQRGTTARASLRSFPRVERGSSSLPARRPIPAPWIVRDEAMLHVVRLLERVADSHLNVLLLGETGVGKEVCAELTHAFSSRSSKPLVRVNCAALSEALLDDELFGHERGAFTGAVGDKPGLLEIGSGGTVFLDEIGDIPLTTQLKLLRVLEAKEVRRLGAVKARTLDVRIVAATHQDLREAITRGRFREDLFYRLDGISVIVPPLRDRPDDIEPLARHFSRRVAQPGKSPPELAPETVAWLLAHDWPGNVRELRNTMERAAVLCDDGVIRREHLQVSPAFAERKVASARPAGEPAASSSTDLRTEVKALERARIEAALVSTVGNQRLAAQALGMSRGALLRRLEQLGISRRGRGRD